MRQRSSFCKAGHAASKFVGIGLTQSIALNLAPDKVRAKHEAQVPLGRGCTYEDAATAVIFLASDEFSDMTGQAINATGDQEMR